MKLLPLFIVFIGWAAATRERRQFGFGGLGSVASAVPSSVASIANSTGLLGCFKTDDGYDCCSRTLLTFLDLTLNNPLVQPFLQYTNLDKVADEVLNLVQAQYGTSFEIVVAPSDFVSKNHFRGDLMCKTKSSNGKTLLAYATPVPYSIAKGVVHRLSDSEIKALNLPVQGVNSFTALG